MDRLASLVLRRRRWVIGLWAVVFLAGAAASGAVAPRLSSDFSLPGQPGYETSKRILATYGNGGFNPPSVLVLTVPKPQNVLDRAVDIDRVVKKAVAATQALPVLRARKGARASGPIRLRVVTYLSSGRDPAMVTKDVLTTYALVFTPQPAGYRVPLDTALAPQLARAAAGTGITARVTGYLVLERSSTTTKGLTVLQETLLGGLGALAVLAFVFASFLALVPLLVAGVSILTTLLVVLLLTTFTEVSFLVQFLVSLIGLGVAIDYSLLVVTRWREQRAYGLDNHDAVRAAMRTAGRAVVASGVTVAVSLVALVVLPVPFLRSVGYGGMLIPLVSMLVTLTLLPALLGGVGPRFDVPRIRKESSASRPWTAWTRLVIRFRWLAAIASVALLTALAAPLAGLQIGTARTASLTSSGPAYDALHTLAAGGISSGVVTPIEVLMRAGSPDAVLTAVRKVPGVATAFAPNDPSFSVAGTRLITVVPLQETVDNSTVKVVDRLAAALRTRPEVLGITGRGALVNDYVNAVYKTFPYVLLLIVVLTYVLLARTFRSLLLPLKAVLLNLLSVSATFGAAVLFWQQGYGSEQVFGIAATGAITFWLPLMIFAFLFGLSMDYEVFILARIREEYDRTGRTESSIVEGLGRTGRLVTSAALILFLSFVALAAAPNTDVKVFATALGVGILLDATVVRAVLLPALVSLFGSWNWWLPDRAARLLRVDPSPVGRGPALRPDREAVDARLSPGGEFVLFLSVLRLRLRGAVGLGSSARPRPVPPRPVPPLPVPPLQGQPLPVPPMQVPPMQVPPMQVPPAPGPSLPGQVDDPSPGGRPPTQRLASRKADGSEQTAPDPLGQRPTR